MNGSPQVSAGTREAVLAAASELGFRVNRVAGSLRKNRSQMLGLVMSDVANIFFAEVVRSVEIEAALHNYSVILANSGEDIEREEIAVIGLMEQRVEGLIVAPAEGKHGYLKRSIPENFPIVAINRMVGETECGAVLSDNKGGARLAVQYLADRGHTRIGTLVGSAGLMTSRERLAGYKAAMRKKGLPLRDEWIGFGGLRAESACAAALKLLGAKDRPTALFASSNVIAEGVLLAMRQLGLQRTTDVEVIGFDDVPWARLVDPPMPVIAQDTNEIGRQAVRMLIGLIGSRDKHSETIRVPTRLLTNEIMASSKNTAPAACFARHPATIRVSGEKRLGLEKKRGQP
jgi:LacI family transcriptional regulator